MRLSGFIKRVASGVCLDDKVIRSNEWVKPNAKYDYRDAAYLWIRDDARHEVLEHLKLSIPPAEE